MRIIRESKLAYLSRAIRVSFRKRRTRSEAARLAFLAPDVSRRRDAMLPSPRCSASMLGLSLIPSREREMPLVIQTAPRADFYSPAISADRPALAASHGPSSSFISPLSRTGSSRESLENAARPARASSPPWRLYVRTMRK